MVNHKWEQRFMDMAQLVASWSKDPSTQVGSVIVRPDRTIVSVGYNGFPRGVFDFDARYEEREMKYRLVVHAEANAIVAAGESVHGYTMFCNLMPCCECAKLVIQAGIKTVVVPSTEVLERYAESMEATKLMFRESGVELRQLGQP
jgi:dCMP deaminase